MLIVQGVTKSFQSTHVFPHPTETKPGEISVTWTHALSKVFFCQNTQHLLARFFSKQKSWRRFVYHQVTKCLKLIMANSFGTVPPIPKLPPFGDFWWWQQYSCEKVCSKKKSNLLQLWRQPCAFFGGTHGRWDQTTLPNPKLQIPTTETQTSLEVKEYIVS